MRPLAVELAFDQTSDQRLGRVWSRLLELYGGPKDSELGVLPHITLALFRIAQRPRSQEPCLVSARRSNLRMQRSALRAAADPAYSVPELSTQGHFERR